MFAYVLVLLGVVSRYVVAPHVAWLNFTAVTGSLIYFGARRSWREMIAPLGLLAVSDYLLTTFAYHYTFHWQSYMITWTWYVMAMVLGQILLHAKTNVVRVAAGAILGPTSFFLVSNFGVWCTFGMYPPTLAGLGTCYLAALPFYRNDLVATSIVLGAAFLCAGARQAHEARTTSQSNWRSKSARESNSIFHWTRGTNAAGLFGMSLPFVCVLNGSARWAQPVLSIRTGDSS